MNAYLVNSDLGSSHAAMIFGETGFSKKGRDSIGVARQYNPAIRRMDNCQVGLFAAYAAENGYSFVDKRLFVPENWFTNAYRIGREKCEIPANSAYKSKPRLAAEMLQFLREENALPFKYIVGNFDHGIGPEFIEAAQAMTDRIYMIPVAENTLCKIINPISVRHQYRRRGKIKTKTTVMDANSKPISAKSLASGLCDFFWYRHTISGGIDGPTTYEFARQQVNLSQTSDGRTPVWLLIRRPLTDKSQYAYFISNAPSSVQFRTLVWLSGLSWVTEQCFEETRHNQGLGRYEVRKLMGWHHHMLICMMAHFFLWHLKIKWEKSSTEHYGLAS